MKKYHVELSGDERSELEALVGKGQHSAREMRRALVLLAAAEGEKDEDIAAKVRTTANTVARIRRRFAEGGLANALKERPRPGKPRQFDGRQEAYVIALACSDPPEGYARWTLRLLAGRLVELEFVDEISHHTVGRVLKRGTSSPGSAASGALPL